MLLCVSALCELPRRRCPAVVLWLCALQPRICVSDRVWAVCEWYQRQLEQHHRAVQWTDWVVCGQGGPAISLQHFNRRRIGLEQVWQPVKAIVCVHVY